MSPSRFRLTNEQLQFLVSGAFLQVPSSLEEDLEKKADNYFTTAMKPPNRPDLPFFAYGLFKPGQLGFDTLREHANNVVAPAYVEGSIFERDGVPLFTDTSRVPNDNVTGAILTFFPGQADCAYRKIAQIEPEKLYQWGQRKTVDGTEVNVLVTSSTNGAQHIEAREWDGRRDPHFTKALDVVEAMLNRGHYDQGTVERLFELQMSYMLLWAAIERYTSLRYHLGTRTMAKIGRMAKEQGFRQALCKYATRQHTVYSTQGEEKKLRADKPRDAIEYYYQVRCNVSHRGKAVMVDAELLEKCICEMLNIFRETVRQAFEECKF